MTVLTSQLLIGLCVALLLMVITWFWAIRYEFYSSVDVAWSYGFGILAVIFAYTGDGWTVRTFIFALMISLWSIRLGTHLITRLKAHYPKEDGRYSELRRKWSKNLNFSFLVFFMAQGLSVILLSLPMVLVSLNPSEVLVWQEYLGIVLWFVAICGESVADFQLNRFKKDPANHGKVCSVGLWKSSRHPNYFFEWMIWISFFTFASGSPLGFWTIYCPLIMLYLLFKVTGIPATEEQSLRSRGDLYRQYQKTTSVFVPWFPKKP